MSYPSQHREPSRMGHTMSNANRIMRKCLCHRGMGGGFNQYSRARPIFAGYRAPESSHERPAKTVLHGPKHTKSMKLTKRQQNREAVNAKARARYWANLEKARQQCKRYAQSHRKQEPPACAAGS